MATTRRTFLGRLGLGASSVALFSVIEPPRDPVVLVQGRPIGPMPPSNQYVITNDTTAPLVLHYQATQPEGYEGQPNFHDQHDTKQRQTSAILLPSEELTITVMPMAV